MYLLWFVSAFSLSAAQADTSYLYRTLLIRAAPGSLLEVIDMYQQRSDVYESAGDHAPFIARHSQGDHWDLLMIFPMQSFEAYYAADRSQQRARAARRAGVSDDEFRRRLDPHVAWREEVFMKGPPLEQVAATLHRGNYYHIEMFIAIPGKRGELLREREMENVYLAQLDRPQNLIFTRAAGAAWDAFTLGVYRDIKHYAESADIPEEREEAAAVVAGFEGANTIGVYLRTLIHRHNDTLANAVRR